MPTAERIKNIENKIEAAIENEEPSEVLTAFSTVLGKMFSSRKNPTILIKAFTEEVTAATLLQLLFNIKEIEKISAHER